MVILSDKVGDPGDIVEVEILMDILGSHCKNAKEFKEMMAKVIQLLGFGCLETAEVVNEIGDLTYGEYLKNQA